MGGLVIRSVSRFVWGVRGVFVRLVISFGREVGGLVFRSVSRFVREVRGVFVRLFLLGSEEFFCSVIISFGRCI